MLEVLLHVDSSLSDDSFGNVKLDYRLAVFLANVEANNLHLGYLFHIRICWSHRYHWNVCSGDRHGQAAFGLCLLECRDCIDSAGILFAVASEFVWLEVVKTPETLARGAFKPEDLGHELHHYFVCRDESILLLADSTRIMVRCRIWTPDISEVFKAALALRLRANRAFKNVRTSGNLQTSDTLIVFGLAA